MNPPKAHQLHPNHWIAIYVTVCLKNDEFANVPKALHESPTFALTEASVVKRKDLGNRSEPPQVWQGSGQWRLEFGHINGLWTSLNNIWAVHWYSKALFSPLPLRNILKVRSWAVSEAVGYKHIRSHFQPKAIPQARAARAAGIDLELLDDMLKVGDAQTDIPTLQLTNEANCTQKHYPSYEV